MGRSRKNLAARLRASDISAVEAGLEAVRTEQITAGAPIAEQPDEVLFFLDQRGAVEPAEVKKLKERGLLLKRPLRIDEILRPQSKIPALSRVRSSSSGERPLIERQMKAIKGGRGNTRAGNHDTQKTQEEDLDIWSGSSIDESQPSVKVRKPVVRVPAVKVASAGSSYRPSPEEHEKLLKRVEEAKEKKRQEQARIKQLQPAPQLLTAAVLADVDLAVQLGDDDDDDEVAKTAPDGQDSGASDAKGSSSAKTIRKTEKERKKEARKRVRVLQQREAQAAKRERSELHQLALLARQARVEAAEQEAALLARRQARKERLATKLKRLGKVAFVPAPVAVNQPEELDDSLRRMKTEGNLVVERFKSLQERALIEPMSVSRRAESKPKKIRWIEPRALKNFV